MRINLSAIGLGDSCPMEDPDTGVWSDPCAPGNPIIANPNQPAPAPVPGTPFTCPSGLVVMADATGAYVCPPVSGPGAAPAPLPISSLPTTGTPQLPLTPVVPGTVYGAPGSAGAPSAVTPAVTTYLIYGVVAIGLVMLVSSMGGRRR
jgi:hypothetical protein